MTCSQSCPTIDKHAHHKQDNAAGDAADDLGVGDDALLDGVQATRSVKSVGGGRIKCADLFW